MKKLLVLALSAIMVLSMAAVSMAAVTVGGEFRFQNDWNKMDNVNNNEKKEVNGLDRIESKVTVTADMGDGIKGFIALKGNTNYPDGVNATKDDRTIVIDENWISMTGDMASLKVGYFGYGFGGKKDILDLYMRDLKAESGLLGSFKVADGMAIDLYYAIDGSNAGDIKQGDGAYAVAFKYDSDTFGGSIATANYATNGTIQAKLDSGIALNGYYKLDAITFYLIYDTIKMKATDKDAVNTILGVMYDSPDVPFYGRFEYDINDQKDVVVNENAKFNGWGLRLGYKISSNLFLETQRKQQQQAGIYDGGYAGETSMRLRLVF